MADSVPPRRGDTAGADAAGITAKPRPQRATQERAAAAPARSAPPAKRSPGKILLVGCAALAVCGCILGVPLSFATYYLLLAPVVAKVDNLGKALAERAEANDPALELAKPERPGGPPNIDMPQADVPQVEPKADPPVSELPKPEPPPSDPVQQDKAKADGPKADAPKNPPGDQLAQETLKRVKEATVYLRVTLPDGRVAQGSGFFAGSANVVVTNGHVLGMLSHEGRPPQKIEVVVNSGTAQEKTYVAKLGQVDANDDLAAVVVAGKDLPPPLTIGLAKNSFETQTVFVVGFPFGKQLGRNITVSKTSISSVRTKPGGAIQDLVVNGGMHPGNSGGPVVDGNGVVVGVSVAIVKGTQINFAIAGETVKNFLAGRMDKRVYMSPYKEGDKLKLPIRFHLTDPIDQIATVVVETWTGKPGPVRPAVTGGVKALPGDSPHRSFELGYKNHKAEGEVDLPVLGKDEALWVQLALVRRDGTRSWYSASTYPNQFAPLERKPVTLAYEHRPDSPCRLDMLHTTNFKVRNLDGTDKHFVTEIKAQMIERLIGAPDGSGAMAGNIAFTKVEVKRLVDKEVKPDPDMITSLKSLSALRAMTLVNKQGDLKPVKMAIGKNVRDPVTVLDLAFLGGDLLQSLEAVTVPLPGQEVVHERPWKVQRSLKLGSQRASQPAVMDVEYILHGLRERNGRPEAVILLFGQVRGAAGAVLSAGGYMDGVASVDVKTNQVRFAEANLNLDLDVSNGKESTQLNGTLKITLVRTPLEGAERERVVKEPGTPVTPPVGPEVGPVVGGPVVGGKTKIQGGVNDPEFSEAAPEGGLLVGFEIGLSKFFNNDVVRAMRPVFRVGDKETLGTQRGTELARVVKVVAKPGYAVGAITAKAGLTVDGMSVTFMKIAGGKLDPTDAYESEWIGGKGGGAPMRLGGNGTPVIGVIGKSNNRDMTGLGLLLRQ